MKFQGEREERKKMHDLRRSQGGKGSSTLLAIGDVLESNRFLLDEVSGQCTIGPPWNTTERYADFLMGGLGLGNVWVRSQKMVGQNGGSRRNVLIPT